MDDYSNTNVWLLSCCGKYNTIINYVSIWPPCSSGKPDTAAPYSQPGRKMVNENKNPQNKQFIGFKLLTILSNETLHLPAPSYPGVTHPSAQCIHVLDAPHLSSLSSHLVIRSAVMVSQCLCSSQPYFT